MKPPRASGDNLRRGGRRHVSAGELALFACLGLGAAVFLLPLYVMVVTALKPLAEVTRGTMLDLPRAWTLAPLAKAWSTACIAGACDGLAPHLWTSLRIVCPAVAASVSLGAVNGYALTKWRLPGAHLLFGLLLAGNLIPYQVVLLPLALTLRRLGLFGTLAGLILVHVAYGLPYTTLLFRNFYLAVPQEVTQAARLDGARFWSIFVHVIVPLSGPIVAVAVVLQFTAIWNEYLFGLVFGGDNPPVTVSLNNLINNEGGEKEYNVDMAGVLLTTLPTLVVYLCAGRWFLRGLASAPGRS